MKYIAIFDDNMLSNFRLDDTDKLTLVMGDKNGYNRAVRLKPIIRPVLTVTEDCGGIATNSVYLTDGHINAMKKYEEIKNIKEFLISRETRRQRMTPKHKINEYVHNDLKKLHWEQITGNIYSLLINAYVAGYNRAKNEEANNEQDDL